MATKAILGVIYEAIQAPENYCSGKEKNQLRVAFDALCSQAYESIFGEEPMSRMNARQKLNSTRETEHTIAEWIIIVALREAIKESEHTLHAKDYSDHIAYIEHFINGPLNHLYHILA